MGKESSRNISGRLILEKGSAWGRCYTDSTMQIIFRLLIGFIFLAAVSVGFSAPFSETSGDNEGIAINQTEALAYPMAMTLEGILKGEVQVVISVDAEGRLNDTLVVGYTNAAFAKVAVDALRRWKFSPARARGVARASRAHVLFVFTNENGVMFQALPTNASISFVRSIKERYSYLACQLRDLDRIPVPVQVVRPVSPGTGLRAKRTVTVEFYIDEEGRVRVPAIGRDDADDSFAAAAVSAVEQWRFEPPVRKGRAVLVLAKQEFTFVPKS